MRFKEKRGGEKSLTVFFLKNKEKETLNPKPGHDKII